MNSLEICKGLITRRRQTRICLEQAVLDFFVVCDKVSIYLDKMIVDEERKFSLTNFSKKSSGERTTDTDHMTLILDLNISVPKVITQRVEFYNLKNTECQEIFKKVTTNTNNHSKCFSDDLPLNIQTKKWEKSLKASLAKSFKKVRLSGKVKKTELKIALEKRSELRNKLKHVADNIELAGVNDEIENIEDLICNLASSQNSKKVRDILGNLSTSEGMFSQTGCWKMKRKMFPKNIKSSPSAKLNSEGRLISGPKELKVLYNDTYKHRLRHRPIKPGLEFIKTIKDDLCKKRLELVKLRREDKWSLDELITVLKSLKFNKSRDPHGLVNEIFHPNVIGADLLKSLLMMFNRIKKEVDIPEMFQFANIVSIYKGKGAKNDLQNDRGIFIMNILRSIMMKMVYNDEYDTIDSNMSDSNIGARKDKNIRNHIFILNGIINEAIKSKRCVDIQILDYRQCFDSMWLEECINDLYDYGVKGPNLALIYEANRKNRVSVMTPNGLTDRITIESIVMQGEVFGPLECSSSIDTFGKECLTQNKFLYMYKGVKVPPLAMIDDLLCISNCGLETVELNSYINAKTKLKKLQFGADKCHKMHIGPKKDFCPTLSVDGWKNEFGQQDEFVGQKVIKDVTDEKYLGDMISANGSNKKNVEHRRAKAFGTIKSIMTILEDIPFGQHYFEVAKLLRNSLFLSSLLLNSEVWYGLTLKEIEIFEHLDLILLKQILETPKSTPNSGVYLELGCIPIRFIIKGRRIMFLHYLLQQNEKSLLYSFFQKQHECPSKGDWWLDVQKDLIELKLTTSLDEISKISKLSFKSKIKVAIQEAAFEFLKCSKNEKSKLKDLLYDELKIQKYFNSDDLLTSEKKLLFQLRTRMLNVKENFKNAHLDLVCPLCQTKNDTQQHLLECQIILKDSCSVVDPEMQYSDLFGKDVRKQALLTRIFRAHMKTRSTILSKETSPYRVTQVI